VSNLGFVGKGAAPLVRQLGVEIAGRFFFFCFPWFYGLLVESGSPEVVSPGDWLVSSIWFLLSTEQVATGTWGNSLSLYKGPDLFLFSPGSSCIALQLQLWLVSSSPSNSILSITISPTRLSQPSTMAPLWEVDLLPHPCFQPLWIFLPSFTEIWLHALALLSRGQVQHSTPPPLFMLFSFVGWVQSSPGSELDYIPGEWVGELWVVYVAHLLGLQVYKGSFKTGQQGEMACCFSQGRYFLGLGSACWGIE
jgi:hypothetical protein